MANPSFFAFFCWIWNCTEYGILREKATPRLACQWFASGFLPSCTVIGKSCVLIGHVFEYSLKYALAPPLLHWIRRLTNNCINCSPNKTNVTVVVAFIYVEPPKVNVDGDFFQLLVGIIPALKAICSVGAQLPLVESHPFLAGYFPDFSPQRKSG